MGQTVACANQKGGVGKTTTVVNLGSYLALAGDRVLVVDLDPQGNATSGLGIDRATIDRSVYQAVIDGVPLADLTQPGPLPDLDVVPSTVSLAGAEIELAPAEGRERRLRRLLDAVVDQYDYVLIDCPPNLGLLTVNGLVAANSVIIPVQTQYYAMKGLNNLVKVINMIRMKLNRQLRILGLLPTFYDSRTNLARDMLDELRLSLIHI